MCWGSRGDGTAEDGHAAHGATRRQRRHETTDLVVPRVAEAGEPEVSPGFDLVLVTNADLSSCAIADVNGDGRVTVDESIAATGNAHEGCGTHPTGPPGGGPVQIELGVVAGTAGLQATFSATLHTFGENVAGTQNDIFFDSFIPIGETVGGQPNCERNPAIDKQATVFAFIPAFCTPGSGSFSR